MLLTTSLQSPELIIWSICIGANVALWICFIVRKIQGDFLLQLLEKGSSDEESALPLSKIKHSPLLPLFLKTTSTLSSVASTVTTDSGEIAYFIPAEREKKARTLSIKGMKWYIMPFCPCC